MRKRFEVAGIALSAIASAAISIGAMAAPAQAATTLMVAGVGTPTIPDLLMRFVLGGEFSDDERVSVYWPAQAGPYIGLLTMGQSIAVGSPILEAEIRDAVARGETVKVVGVSAGALVVDEALRDLADDPSVVDPTKVTFIVVGDGSRQGVLTGYDPILDYDFEPLPDTRYNVVVVKGEYDGYVDLPDDMGNFLAVTNAVAGGLFMHISSAYTDLDTVPAENITVTYNSVGGKTTTYLIPAKRLPLVQLLPFLAPFEEPLKEMIDAGYDRTDEKNPAAGSVVPGVQMNVDSSTPAVDPAVTVPKQRFAAGGADALAHITQRVTEAAAEGFTRAEGRFADATDRGAKVVAERLNQTPTDEQQDAAPVQAEQSAMHETAKPTHEMTKRVHQVARSVRERVNAGGNNLSQTNAAKDARLSSDRAPNLRNNASKVTDRRVFSSRASEEKKAAQSSDDDSSQTGPDDGGTP